MDTVSRYKHQWFLIFIFLIKINRKKKRDSWEILNQYLLTLGIIVKFSREDNGIVVLFKKCTLTYLWIKQHNVYEISQWQESGSEIGWCYRWNKCGLDLMTTESGRCIHGDVFDYPLSLCIHLKFSIIKSPQVLKALCWIHGAFPYVWFT